MSIWAIIAAAGAGTRMGGDRVKTLQTLGGRPVINHSVQRLRPQVDGIIIAVREQDIPAFEEALAQDGLSADRFVIGGRERRDSVENALAALPEDCDLVLVHDGARPLVSDALIRRVIESARALGSGVPALRLTDTVKRLDREGRSAETVDREMLRTVQTPQAFSRVILEAAYAEGVGPATDDAALVEQIGLPVHLVPGDKENIKLTLPGDLERAQELLQGRQLPRVGLGYDAHRLTAGRPLILCGVEIACDRGLLGHSDADVATHALIDALLGAAGLPDIGSQFPDSDPAYKGISSITLLGKTLDMLVSRGFMPYNVDITIAAQAPRLQPHIPRMRALLAGVLGLSEDRVAVKATTTEGLGFEGRGEGISARAAVLIRSGPG